MIASAAAQRATLDRLIGRLFEPHWVTTWVGMTGNALLSLAIRPKSQADQERLARGVATLLAEDPTMSVNTDAATGEVVIAGMASCSSRSSLIVSNANSTLRPSSAVRRLLTRRR